MTTAEPGTPGTPENPENPENTESPENAELEERIDLSARDLWQRYRGISGISLGVGALAGCLVMLTSSSGNRHLLGYMFLLGGSLGVVNAAIARLGGSLFLLYRANKTALSSSEREYAGAAGTALAVFTAWLVLAFIAAPSGAGAGMFLFILPIAIIPGVITGMLATFGLHWAENRWAKNKYLM